MGPPNNVIGVMINVDNVTKIARDKDLDAADKMLQVIAHELGHAVNTYHHGERDGKGSSNNKHGPRSGNLTCVMRYDNIGSTAEAIGTELCTSKNKNLNFDVEFGTPAADRGGCSEQFRVSGSSKKPEPKNRSKQK
jgi:hypothetical protein